jgi:hypothetical protein
MEEDSFSHISWLSNSMHLRLIRKVCGQKVTVLKKIEKEGLRWIMNEWTLTTGPWPTVDSSIVRCLTISFYCQTERLGRQDVQNIIQCRGEESMELYFSSP